MSGTTCLRFHEDIVGLLEGTASDALRDHVASCDACRDSRHDLEGVVLRVVRAGDGLSYTPALAERLAALVDEASASGAAASGPAVPSPATAPSDDASRTSEMRMRGESAGGTMPLAAPLRPASGSALGSVASPSGNHGPSAPAASGGHYAAPAYGANPVAPGALVASSPAGGAPTAPVATPTGATASAAAPRPSRKAVWLLLAACASVGVSAVVGFKLADRHRSPELAATRAWHGKVGKVVRSGAEKTGGLSLVTSTGKTELAEGAEIKAGMHLSTDGRTRARVELDDGSFVVLDRATDLTVDAAPRTVHLDDGALIADVAHVEKAPGDRIVTKTGEVRVLGTRLTVTALPERMNVEVVRGEIEVAAAGGAPQRVSAGQEGVVQKDGRIDVAPANDLAQRAAFGEQLLATHNEDTEASASGLGELRARKPGKTDEKDHAVRLARHAVKVRIAGNVARTEIDEEFFNDTADELEGIYRFPLPNGAQIERLALEVDGKLLDGEFIDKAKAAAIWRGAIQNAAPKAPRPREELVWVPGPWHDPALLEWARGGRFELKIFPIPKKASRRVVIAYTETVAPVSGVRRYVYPLPQGTSSKLTIDQFSVDAQVLRHDAKTNVIA